MTSVQDHHKSGLVLHLVHLMEPHWTPLYFPMQKLPKMQSLMFIGVSGNAPFLETYWRHIFLTYPLPWLVAIRSESPIAPR
jgi:hypothetical protein